MEKKEKGWLYELIVLIPELPGIVLLLVGLAILYWSKKGDAWMYDTGGPGIFTNITWIKNTFGERTARRFNVLMAWGIILAAIALILIGVWLHLAIGNGKK